MLLASPLLVLLAATPAKMAAAVQQHEVSPTPGAACVGGPPPPAANSTPPMPTEGRQQTGRLQRTPKHPWLAASILGAQCDPPSWGRLGVQQKDAICAPSRSQARVAKTRVGGHAKQAQLLGQRWSP